VGIQEQSHFYDFSANEASSSVESGSSKFFLMRIFLRMASGLRTTPAR
jgi:hypothetical protein